MPDLGCFEALESGLQELGLHGDARWLQTTRTNAYTTSSELLGELGEIVRRIHNVIPTDAADGLAGLFSDCEQIVRLAWPDYRLSE